METPESIRAQYDSPPAGETPEERRKRLTNRRAAKYRYFKSLDIMQGLRREKNNRRQRDRRKQLDESAKSRIREQNRVRQQLRRQMLSDQTRQEIREKQRQRQQTRRTRLDQDAREALRERERLRVRMRRAREARGEGESSTDQDLVARTRESSSTSPLSSPAPSPLSASPLLVRHSRPAMNTNDLLSSALHHHQLVATIQLPPVLGNNSSIHHARSETELPNLQPHLRQIQQQQQQQQLAHLTFSGFQFSSLPSASSSSSQNANPSSVFSDRIPQLPHLQMALPQASSLLNTSAPAPPPPLLYQLAPLPPSSGLPGISEVAASAGMSHGSSIGMLSMSSVPSGSMLLPPTQQHQQPQQLLPSITIPPPIRALPPLPDFLNNRDSFNSSATAIASNSNAYLSFLTTEHLSEYQDGGDTIFRG